MFKSILGGDHLSDLLKPLIFFYESIDNVTKKLCILRNLDEIKRNRRYPEILPQIASDIDQNRWYRTKSRLEISDPQNVIIKNFENRKILKFWFSIKTKISRWARYCLRLEFVNRENKLCVKTLATVTCSSICWGGKADRPWQDTVQKNWSDITKSPISRSSGPTPSQRWHEKMCSGSTSRTRSGRFPAPRERPREPRRVVLTHGASRSRGAHGSRRRGIGFAMMRRNWSEGIHWTQ